MHFPDFWVRAQAHASLGRYASMGRNAEAIRALEESYQAHEV